jgi:NIPSNAP
MSRKTLLSCCLLIAGAMVGYFVMKTTPAQAASGRVFEMRTYTAPPGKLDALNARFRNHTIRLFEKHGMHSIGYWIPQDEPRHSNTIVYIISHESREQAAKNWVAFRADPEWVKASTESEANGKIVEKTVSEFMDPTDYSQIK